MAFLYSLLVKLLNPTSLCALLLLAAAVFRKRQRWSRGCFWAALAVLMICGNGWVVGALTQNLEWRYRLPEPAPNADAILVLSGGLRDRIGPRQTIEVAEAGDRELYAAHLFRQKKAGLVICTGGFAPRGVAPRPAAEVMAEFLAMLGVPKEAVVMERGSSNTHEQARNLLAIFEEHKVKRVLLVTSALHMPRSMGVFRKQFPAVEFIPAPTDYHATERLAPIRWYDELTVLVPEPSQLVTFSAAMHEYLGMAYYTLRGWM